MKNLKILFVLMVSTYQYSAVANEDLLGYFELSSVQEEYYFDWPQRRYRCRKFLNTRYQDIAKIFFIHAKDERYKMTWLPLFGDITERPLSHFRLNKSGQLLFAGGEKIESIRWSSRRFGRREVEQYYFENNGRDFLMSLMIYRISSQDLYRPNEGKKIYRRQEVICHYRKLSVDELNDRPEILEMFRSIAI